MKEKLGMAPGTLIYTGAHTTEPVVTHVISYNTEFLYEEEHTGYSGEFIALRKDAVNWINVWGLHNQEVIAKLGSDFTIHNLALEDALNTSELPKSEEFEDHLLFTLKMFSLKNGVDHLLPEHVTLILGNNYLLSLQEKRGDVFEGVRNRIRSKNGKIRSRGNDYLLYALLDTIVDNYFLVVDAYQNQIDTFEQQILTMEEDHVLSRVNHIKRGLIRLRKYIHPLELAIQDVMKFESKFINESIFHFFVDLRNHLTHISLMLNEQRESLNSLTDLHISLISNETNKVMKVLTIIASIFIPLTFLAGIYGMNFKHMPELALPWAYPALLTLMGVLSLVMLFFFKHKKWL